MFKFVVLCVLLGVCAAYSDSSNGHSIELPVKSSHELEEIPIHSEEEEHSTNVEISGGVLPVYLSFKSQSSPLYVKQEHKGTKGSYEKTDSKDEPHRLVHEVTKPVYQEIKEIITPYRKVVQVIEPIHEERLTKVHKGERKSRNGGGNGGGNGGDDKYEKSSNDETKYEMKEDRDDKKMYKDEKKDYMNEKKQYRDEKKESNDDKYTRSASNVYRGIKVMKYYHD